MPRRGQYSRAAERVKHRNMLRDPPVSVTVIGSAGPENCAGLRGRVSMTPDAGRQAGIQLSWKCDGKGPP